MTSLFFAWGFITANNDPLVVALRAAFSLDYSEALLTQIVFFVAYGLLSLPAAWVTSRVGEVDAILGSLGLMAAGCAVVAVSTEAADFRAILAGLFVLAAGFTALQVAANPLAAELGPAPQRHFRLNLAQAFNSLGVVIGVHFGSLVMLGNPGLRFSPGTPDVVQRASLLISVEHAFVAMAALLTALLALFLSLRNLLHRAIVSGARPPASGMFEALRSRWALFGACAIGLYVGAEVSIGSIMINFLNQQRVLGLPLEIAGRYLANFYWGGALVGRLIGTLLLTRVPAARLLFFCGLMTATLCLIVVAATGPVTGYAALSVGLFNSIMFPTIFSITLERSRVSQSATSGLLCLAIFGGALLPLSVGALADWFSLQAAFAVPFAAYSFIVLFALASGRATPQRLGQAV